MENKSDIYYHKYLINYSIAKPNENSKSSYKSSYKNNQNDIFYKKYCKYKI